MLGQLIDDLLNRLRPKRARSQALTSRDMDQIRAALTLERSGRPADAEQIYRELLSGKPDNVDVLHLVGNAARSRGNFDEAIEVLQRAAEVEPASAEVRCHLAEAFAARGDMARAAEHYQRTLELDEGLLPANIGLGHALRKLGRLDAAAVAFRQAIELRPDLAELHVALSGVLRELGRHEDALVACRRAIELAPAHADAQVNLGHALRELGRFEPAIAAYRRAVELLPEAPEAHLHLGNALLVDGCRAGEAAQEFARALALRPDFTGARFNLAMTHLARGDYARGWPDYELRMQEPDWPRRPVDVTHWTGDPLAGKKLLVYSEQGLGDEIMFASCIPDAVAAGAQCVVECLPKLETLFRRSFPQAEVYAVRPDRSLPDNVWNAGIDLQCPIGSLPVHFRRTRAEFPRHRGYLAADAQLIAGWRARLAVLGPGLKVGISWQGGTQKSRRLVRSLPLARWLPILHAQNVHFVDLQYTDCGDEIKALHEKNAVRVHSWQEARTDYEQTAALVAALDLVISVCTAVIHLGGALGRPVWVMAPYSPEWRYGIAGEEMPWYPSVRVFRQAAFNEWDAVIENVAQCLGDMARSRVLS